MSAGVRIVCEEHWDVLGDWCDDDAGYPVESVATARALHAAAHPHATGKIVVVVVRCEAAGCLTMMLVRNAATVGEARAMLAGHGSGWYRARRYGRLIDACQWHLGSCCVQHASPGGPSLDPAAVLPGPQPPGLPDGDGQLDLFSTLEAM